MTIEEAIKSIADKETTLKWMATIALEENRVLEVVQLITDQFNESQMNRLRLITIFGFEVIDTIIKYGRMIQARAESQCMDICIAMDSINYN